MVTHRPMGKGLIFRGSAKCPLQGGGSPIFGVPLYLCIHPLSQNYQISRGNRYREGACFRWSVPPPPLSGRGPSALQFGGFVSIYAYTLWNRTTKFDVVTHVVEGRVSWGQPRLPSQENGVLGLRNFGVYPVFMPTPLNAERPNSAW